MRSWTGRRRRPWTTWSCCERHLAGLGWESGQTTRCEILRRALYYRASSGFLWCGHSAQGRVRSPVFGSAVRMAVTTGLAQQLEKINNWEASFMCTLCLLTLASRVDGRSGQALAREFSSLRYVVWHALTVPGSLSIHPFVWRSVCLSVCLVLCLVLSCPTLSYLASSCAVLCRPALFWYVLYCPVCLSIHLVVCLSVLVCLNACMPACRLARLPAGLPAFLSVCLSACLLGLSCSFQSWPPCSAVPSTPVLYCLVFVLSCVSALLVLSVGPVCRPGSALSVLSVPI